MTHTRFFAFVLVMTAGSTGVWADDLPEETEEVLVQAAPAAEPAQASDQRGDGKFRILPVYRAGEAEGKAAEAPSMKTVLRGTAAMNRSVTVVRTERAVTREATMVTPGGETVVSTDQWEREGGVVTHTGTTTTSGGGSASRESTVVRDEDGASRDAMRVTMSGRTVSKAVRVERATETTSATRMAVTTGKTGGAVTAKDMWKREGVEASHEGVTKTPRAMVHRSAVPTREGSAAKREATRDGTSDVTR